MNFTEAEKISTAVLYEGYMLYPYRASSTKNVQRWNFGTLYPQDYAEMQRPPESFRMVTECLLRGEREARLHVRIRFLHLVRSQGNTGEEWDQGVERTCNLTDLTLHNLLHAQSQYAFSFDEADVPKAIGTLPPPIPKHISLLVILTATSVQPGLQKISMEVRNTTPIANSATTPRNYAMLQSLVSAHTLLGVQEGEFISLLDTPEEFRSAASSCHNVGVFPVLVGSSAQNSMMLCSPIILYDYPKIAPESAGDFYDGTEMDEMLALRVLMLTDEEKREMRNCDERARDILERTETLPEAFMTKLHGAIRDLRSFEDEPSAKFVFGRWDPLAEVPLLKCVVVSGVELRAGDRVTLRPRKVADIIDLALEGKVAVIEAIEQDFEDNIQLAVVLDDDPGREFGMMRQPGHRFFFSPEEVEPRLNVERTESA